MKVYSISTAEGDSLVDSEDIDTLGEYLNEGVGTMRALRIMGYLYRGEDITAVSALHALTGATLTVEEYGCE